MANFHVGSSTAPVPIRYVARNWPNIQDTPFHIKGERKSTTTVAVTSRQSWKTGDAQMRNFTIVKILQAFDCEDEGRTRRGDKR
jgi:hypothetical protein